MYTPQFLQPQSLPQVQVAEPVQGHVEPQLQPIVCLVGIVTAICFVFYWK